ncbi:MULTISPECIES: BamA/TamA family outer membrane protein [unclassified Synechocystis]|uniref:BamA/TamA family outer membrane protein n=1 Tax=unclassified Synechocystis TaxID=2640012 RepID=UPI0004D0DCFC|nr:MULTISPECIES: BamA/TamA family outer membrane protein [unclassified Synechocystis]AIE74779.1 Outer membrane protein/protective antigen OMA87 [Synechocystis sp. PCC 6714]
MTLSPYYRLLLLTSGLVLGASPAQATQPFSPLNMLEEGQNTELLVPPSADLNFPGPTSESEAFNYSTLQEAAPSAVNALDGQISVIPAEIEQIDGDRLGQTMEINAGNLDGGVDDFPSIDSVQLDQANKLPHSTTVGQVAPTVAQQAEQENLTAEARTDNQIGQVEPQSPLMAQAVVEEEVEAVEMEATEETTETTEEAPQATPSFTPDAPPTTTEGTPGPTQSLPSFTPTPPSGPSTTTPAPAQEEPRVLVSEVLITGTTPELELLVYNAIRTQPGRTTTRSQLQEDVNAIYATGYFSNVRVAPSDTPLGVRVTFEVQANPVFTGIDIRTVPEVAEGKERILPQEVVDETFGEQYGKILNLRELQEGIKAINEWYSSQGYDLAQVVGSPQVGADGQVTLVIAEGIVENIQVRFFDSEDEPVQGRTRDFIITREMRLKPGDVFNRNRAQTDLQRVYSLGLFEDVRLSFNPGSDPTEVIVNVDVVEGNTGSIAAGGGISSTSGLFGTISYQEKNLGGNNQTLGVEAQVGQRELLFDVSFTDPWIGGDPFRTSYTANLFRRRTISLVFDGADSSIRTFNGFDSPRVVRTGLGLTFFRPIADDVFSPPDWRLSAGFGYQNVRVENAAGALSPFSAPLNGFDSQPLSFSDYGVDELFTLSFGASQDNRNNPLQPTSGSLVRFGAEQTIPVGTGNIMMTRLRGSYSYYIPVDWLDLTGFGLVESTQPQTVAFNVQAGTVLGDLPPYEAFILGGSNSVRGYQEGELGNGRSFFQATAEYRFPIIAAVGGALFVDYGSNLGSQGAVPGFPAIVRGLPGSGVGYGLGVRIQSPVGPIRIDLGFTGEGESRINFGIGEKF